MPRRTIPPAHRNSSKDGPARIHVIPSTGGWQVRKDGASKASSVHSTQAEAVRAAQAKLQKSGGELRVQGRDGKAKQTYTLGGSAMTKLAAVEGIRFTPAMKRKIEAARDPSLSSEDRRRILSSGLGKARR